MPSTSWRTHRTRMPVWPFAVLAFLLFAKVSAFLLFHPGLILVGLMAGYFWSRNGWELSAPRRSERLGARPASLPDARALLARIASLAGKDTEAHRAAAETVDHAEALEAEARFARGMARQGSGAASERLAAIAERLDARVDELLDGLSALYASLASRQSEGPDQALSALRDVLARAEAKREMDGLGK